MSPIATSWVLAQPISGHQKMTLYVLAGMCDEANSCGPSHAVLEAYTGTSRRTMIRHLQRLEAEGYIKIEAQIRPDGRQGKNRYYLQVDPISDHANWIIPASDEDSPATIVPVSDRFEWGAKMTPPGCQNDTPLKAQASTTNSFSTEDLRSSVSNMPNLPIRHALPKKVRKESRRAEDLRLKQEESDLDPVKIAEAKIGESLASGHGTSTDLEVESEPIASTTDRNEHRRKSKSGIRKNPGPDTLAGLIGYWNTNLGLVEWGSALDDTNITLLTQALSRWKKAGATADEIRGMMDMYAKDPGIRTPGAIPWKDFLNKRALLMHRVQENHQAREQESHRNDPEYWRWSGLPA